MSISSEKVIDIGKLLLDPNNYRFHDMDDYKHVAENRYHELGVQSKATDRLTDESLESLKKSILTNGYVKVERIVVYPYQHKEGHYVVLEGNRRLAAALWILRDHSAGVNVPKSVRDSIAEFQCIVAEGDSRQSQVDRLALLGIRHVSGIKEWGGYQSSKLVMTLMDNYGLSYADVGERLGMTAQKVNRRWRAFRAWQQMRDNEEYGEHAKPRMYPIFHEAVSVTAVKDWLGWDDEVGRFANESELREFYDLVSPIETDAGRREPKVTTHRQVRELRRILENDEAKRVLLNPEKLFEDALAVVIREEDKHAWVTSVEDAISALKGMPVDELKKLPELQRKLLKELETTVRTCLEDHVKLAGS